MSFVQFPEAPSLDAPSGGEALVEWYALTPDGDLLPETASYPTHNLTAQFEMSFVSCTHSEGKSWESLYVPVAASGLTGISITWWNRKRGQAGSVNVKPTSLAEWYTTVGSKAVYKGYQVNSFVGRKLPLSRRHEFVTAIHSSRLAIPSLAFDSASTDWDLVGSRMGVGALKIYPIEQFFRKLVRFGHMPTFKAPVAVTSGSMLSIWSGFKESIDQWRVRASKLSEGEADEPSPIKPVKPVTAADRYDAWGVFG